MRHVQSIARTSGLIAALCFGGAGRTEAALPPGNTVQQWNKIAEDTVLGAGAIQNEGLLYMSYESAAVYDAVVAIAGEYQPYAARIPAAAGASVDAAVIEAAYQVLLHYFPAQAATLTTYHTEALAAVTDGSVAEGVRVGATAAAAIITLREGDGRQPIGTVSTIEDPTCGPGGYRRTPGTGWTLGPQTPWLGEVTPFLLEKAGQFQAPPPVPLASQQWVEQFDEIKRLGSSTSVERTAEQTTIARFWTANVLRQYNLMGRDVITQHGVSVVESARLLAMINIVAADAQINIFHEKYSFLFWRPVTAIDPTSVVNDWCGTLPGVDDGNDLTVEQIGWRPLLNTPNQPEYPGAHGSITSAVAEVLSEFFGTTGIDVDIHGFDPAGAPGNLTAVRHFDTAEHLREEIVGARLWGGLHYRQSSEVAVALGEKVAHFSLNHAFKPAN